MKTSLFVEYQGTQYEEKAIVALVKEAWLAEGNKIKDILSLNLYIKPEEASAYYVINDEFSGKIDL